MLDFTQRKYEAFCRCVFASGYRTRPVRTVVARPPASLEERLLVLRHDVDRFPRYALDMARIEARYGLTATYYFRIPATFDPDLVRRVARLGHEVGLHYECLDKSRGDPGQAVMLLKRDLARFREVADLATASMHGNPLSSWDNRDLWQHVGFDEVGLAGEAYLSMDFQRVLYYSDTGRTWREGVYNLKDVIPAHMKQVRDKPVLRTTDDLMVFLRSDTRNLCLLVHPNRWSCGPFDFLWSWTSDMAVNQAKRLIAATRKASR